MSSPKRIVVCRTTGEWDHIMEKVGVSGDLNRFLKKEIAKLQRKFSECPRCVTVAEGEKESRFHYVSEESYIFLESIAKAMKKPISTVVDELIINPILTAQK